MEDSQIVDLYWARSEDAVKCTQQKYGAYLLKIAQNILSDLQDSEECVNDTYLAAWNSMPENRPPVLSSYLARITRQLSIDLYRKKRSLKRGGEYETACGEFAEDIPGGTDPAEELDAKVLAAEISEFLRGRNKREQDLFVCRYFYMDTVSSCARYCGISVANAKTVLCRLRKDLKEHLLKKGFEI